MSERTRWRVVEQSWILPPAELVMELVVDLCLIGWRPLALVYGGLLVGCCELAVLVWWLR